MAPPSSQAMAVWVREKIANESWVKLSDLVLTLLREKWPGKSEEDLSDHVEEKLVHIAGHLRDYLANAARDGEPRQFEIDSEDSPYIKALIRPPSRLLEKLKRIDPFEFERVCASVLDRLGATSKVTKKTADGGIDFIGANLNIIPQALSVPESCRATVIGQAKRYADNLIYETKLREFVGAATLEAHKLRKDHSIGPLSPVVLAFWTTSDFDEGARAFGRAVGMWYMGGLTLAGYIESLGLTEHVMALPDHRAAQ